MPEAEELGTAIHRIEWQEADGNWKSMYLRAAKVVVSKPDETHRTEGAIPALGAYCIFFNRNKPVELYGGQGSKPSARFAAARFAVESDVEESN
ncbi:hypothetical protein LTR10_019478 [Elasticomyces elasticus]|uniref:Uncharacterized protein n=1 Tax=Exophiala sideris TaxID=1016849 RepID=A0ABR0JKM1_9EURO|nr:hypothetical protein LTR10_019478 [Elasticomyces elasticus]KAK5035518.1 hypothetical protein LTS07_002957 [Exophiala sideris]KAK5039130.1 hypothetical protein LTR13_003386 [Exophiala sideris]KAK5066443.1 hypothetical protein LTR69_002963 [Exophiala sideris]KAK5187120.1 hypothetical protein LTR44_001128 [Eurotiomycetes sp. CCFEE 6388]